MACESSMSIQNSRTWSVVLTNMPLGFFFNYTFSRDSYLKGINNFSALIHSLNSLFLFFFSFYQFFVLHLFQTTILANENIIFILLGVDILFLIIHFKVKVVLSCGTSHLNVWWHDELGTRRISWLFQFNRFLKHISLSSYWFKSLFNLNWDIYTHIYHSWICYIWLLWVFLIFKYCIWQITFLLSFIPLENV